MKGQSNGVMRGPSPPDRVGAHDKTGVPNGSSYGSDAITAETAAVWPPKFAIALTNKEKEEDDFMDIKGSNLPQRPKKRAKFIQRTLNILFSKIISLCTI